jgi:hypothetical protein
MNDIVRRLENRQEDKMEKTIATKFDESALPRWARNDTNVVEIAKRDLAFRCNVHNAKSQALRSALKREASARAYILFNS